MQSTLSCSFDKSFAAQYGTTPAILLQEFIKLSDGNSWLKVSLVELQKELPFLTRSALRCGIDKLLGIGVLEKKAFDLDKFDHTWSYRVKI